MRWLVRTALVAALAAGLPGLVRAQAPPVQAGDSAPSPPPPLPRAAWLSDRLPLRVGDLLTVIIDEQAAASERVSTNASADRALRTGLGINLDSAVRLGPSKAFSSTLNNASRDVGEARRSGNLSAVLTVRVIRLDAAGVAAIEGAKSVTVDGRLQEVHLEGLVRPEDVTPSNLISSTRIAGAVITYKGKKISPKTGILGKILSILWP